jgi:hypothetical protein
VDEYDVHDGVVIDCLKHGVLARPQQLEELRDQAFGVRVVVDRRVVVLVEDELERGVVDQFLETLHVALGFLVVQLEAES